MDTNKMRDLKALAEAAPSGPWLVENDSMYFKDDGYTRHMLDADSGMDVEEDKYCAALAFIAAANPAAVLALLAEIEQLREANERVCTNYNRVSFASEERGNERDQLKAQNEALRDGANFRAIQSLRDDCEALRKDAERYRWITENADVDCRGHEMGREYGSLDECIDAAMAKDESHD